MKKTLSVLLLLSAAMPFAPLGVQAASFDCAKASTSVEKLICKTPSLSRADEELGAIYKQAVAVAVIAESVKKEQRGWIARRNECSSAQCLAEEYGTRLLVLRASLTQDAAPSPPAGQPLLVRPAQAETQVVPGRTLHASVVGIVEFGHDAAGGRYDLVSGNARITLSYVWHFSDADLETLSSLDERKTRVRVVGMLKVYAEDGSAAFAQGAPFAVYAAQ
ncbi:lysozyme inhibitor LprI family protein [Azospirillum picis]|uniref:Uncharacterized protein YecT (DUF1311 family) n=1 Tax=Azospirillum picis TaxID=488438 RepID=A0ABU0MQS0_9PROT|nr:lysozyme inhibitor LprI family protein [Azospirillum picis]MBP2302245.1 uncharacterized protein YecT (DUF1311 family) [Azospirillum picis]MDQ0535824.1 uncharacterized protein YecT (DUF1311 family) [Azospirillum picis]